MAFHNVNPKKLAFLLAQGTHDIELKKFFLDSKMQLILKGAKVQNLPHGHEELIRTICERLPQKTDVILRTWFNKNITESDPTPLPDVVPYLTLYFDEAALPDDDGRLVARSALVYLFSDEPDEALLSFLRRAPGAPADPPQEEEPRIAISGTETGAAASDSPPLATSLEAMAPKEHQVAELLASVISGDEIAIDNALVPFSENTRALVDALISIRDGDIDAATENLKHLTADSPELALIQKALSRACYQRGANSLPTGIREVLPLRLTEYPEAESYDIVGIYTNVSETGVIFVQPICLVLNGKLFSLSHEDRVKLFPESGDVITHRTAVRRLPQRREIVRWKVAEHEAAGGRARFRLESELSPLLEIIRLPVPSKDPDEVRDQIKSRASTVRQLSGQQVIFLLSDGVAVASPKVGDITRDEAFDQPWQAWSSLDTWLIEGRQYCLDLLQAPASQLDLSPLETAFKKLIKNLEADQKSTLNRAQIRELADLIRNSSAGEAALRARRITASINQIVLDGEALDLVLPLLNSREEVQRRVEELVTKEVEKRQAERSGLLAEIDSLKRKKEELAKEGRELERNNRKRAESAAASVKDAFSKAIEEGVATLATAEIFRTLSGALGNTAKGMSEVTLADSIESRMRHGALALPQVKSHLSVLGLNGRQAIALARLSAIAAQSGVGLFLKGHNARQYVQVLARLDSETSGLIEIPMGLTSGTSFRRALASVEDAKTLAILDADLSPFEVYGSQLLDFLFDSATEGQGGRSRILLSCLGSDISLPLPDVVQRVAITVDLDSPWDQGQRNLVEIEEDSIPLLRPLRAKVFDGLSQLEGVDRDLVERVLITALTPDE
ncbi:hypothetical protein [Chromobacterium rhizoryzae]|uniref:Uncharacterized protein n=1 Tax=Chromobacterium rhizoryzae TaxID=1778675 RepID=A0AAD0RNF6_9NEIS|nr:hypothetical protein [Chromobacterium rhizoryzae]AXT44689.1 hypothetical protein D1345_00020 [Chromobacterium rhizoryzae]